MSKIWLMLLKRTPWMMTELRHRFPIGGATWKVFFLFVACATPLLALAAESNENQYAPDRKVDIRHLALDVTPDFANRSVRGEATLVFAPIGKPLEELRLDGVDLTVDAVTCSAMLAGYQVTDKEIVITFAKPLAVGQETKLTIRYAAQPRKGLYFRSPSNGYPAEETHLWTQGETGEARHWFPCYDYPNAKFTSEITCRVPEGMMVLSNGRQISATKDPATKLVAVRWLEDKPHANYLLTLVAGHFTMLEDKHRDVPLRFYTLPGDAEQAALSFAPTKPAMEFFEHEIGVPFPWAQYGQVVVRDFYWGGMENTTLTTLTESTLHTVDTENLCDSDNLIAHELAHQWFGDFVTCKDWSQTWLNESFATYYADLFEGHQYGRDTFLYRLHKEAQAVFAHTNTPQRAVVFRRYHQPWEQFDYRTYPKGAWVLHMLRNQLGDDLYRRCIQTYLQRHAFGTVVTEDLNAVIEELSGRSYDQFFDQWIYHSGQPELDIAYSWDEKTRLAKITVRQTQSLNDNVLLFRFPLTLCFKTPLGHHRQRVEIKQQEEDFYIPLGQQPTIVRVDPDLAVLAGIHLAIPKAMLYAQLADNTDAIGRVLAAEHLADHNDTTTIAKLRDALTHDTFHGVRIQVADSLRKIHNDDALDALIASTKQPDARARNAVITAIAGYFHPRACDALRRSLETERNPVILATAIKGLASYHEAAVRDTLVHCLRADSYQNRIADAAIAALRAQDDPAAISPLRDVLARREAVFTSSGYSEALKAIAYLGRNEKNRDDLLQFLAAHLHHKREPTQLAAIRALGALEDPRAIAILDTFANAAKETPAQQEGEKAIAALRAVNKPSDNLKDLRQEMLDLKKEMHRQQQDLDAIKKRLDANRP